MFSNSQRESLEGVKILYNHLVKLYFDQVNDFEGKSVCGTIMERERLNTE